MNTLYLDTNIFLNIILKENDFYESSSKLMQSIELNEYLAITSFLTIMEVHRVLQKQNKTLQEIENIIENIQQLKIKIIIPESTDIISAYELLKLYNLNPPDAIHIAIALENANYFITRDETLLKKERIKSVLEIQKPDKLKYLNNYE